MTAFPENISPAKLLISRNDEIGQLARRFEEMSEVISKNLNDLKKAKSEVEEAVREKEAFLENMSHEIRNPLHAMIGMIHLLEKNNPGRHQQVFIETLKFNSNNLLSLVNDILDYKKLSSGQIIFHPEWLYLPEFVQKMINSHRFHAASKKIGLDLHIDDSLNHIWFLLDPLRLNQILNNLVSNALKFTPEKGIVNMKVFQGEKGAEKMTIRFSIRDTGPGIPQDKVQKIQERYYSKEEFKDPVMGTGAGLGLPIVTQLLKLQDTRLHIKSAPGKGSHFYFDIKTPFKIHYPEDERKSASLPIHILDGAKILTIDDDPQIQALYVHLLEETGAQLTTLSDPAASGDLPKEPFDIILSDFLFQGSTIIDYWDLLEKFTHENSLLFLVSGKDLEDLSHPISRYLKETYRKPVNPKELMRSIITHYASQQFGLPNIKSFWEDYDHQEAKVRKALGILVDEWEKMSSQLETAISNNDPKSFVAVRHKLITSVRRLELDLFEKVLLEPPTDASADFRFPPGYLQQVQKMMEFYIFQLRGFR